MDISSIYYYYVQWTKAIVAPESILVVFAYLICWEYVAKYVSSINIQWMVSMVELSESLW